MLSHDVVVWSIRKRRRTKPFQLRWKVGGESQSKAFLTRTLADDFRSDLLQAAKRGELFDTKDGLPASLKPSPEQLPPLTWLEFICDYVDVRWSGIAAQTRRSIVDGLASATLVLTTGDAADLPSLAVRGAARWLMTSERTDQPAEDLAYPVKLLSNRGTRPLSDLADPLLRQQLWDALGVKLDGGAATHDTASDRRRVVSTAFEHAVDRGLLPANPFRQVKRKKVAASHVVDRRVVANPRQAEELLTAVSYVGSWKRGRGRRLVAFFATLYYAGARPGEVLGLREQDCHLPATGWGALILDQTVPSSGKKYTNSGEVHDWQGLKQRPAEDVRPVPIPPRLVRILRDHIETFGTADDGRLFRNERGGIVGSTTYLRVWREARQLALPAHVAATPLAGTAYDLRHAALSTWLNSGVDPTDVAERAGNSVDVLMKRYAKCLDGSQERNNKLIEQALDDAG